MRLLSCEGLQKHYGGVTAVDGVSLAVEEQETLGIIGSNGAGKTTLFNILTGFERPDGGTITLRRGGRELPVQGGHAFKLARMGVGRTFQNLRLFEQMTVYGNIQTAILSLGCTKLNIDGLLRLLGLAERADTLVSSLPYGVRKKTELARALVCACGPENGCRLLFLDEPAAGLTTAEAYELAALLRDVKARYRLTLVLIEHHMAFLESLCGKLCAMDEGRVIACGAPGEVLTGAAVQRAIFGEG